jgi:hypothetical protein
MILCSASGNFAQVGCSDVIIDAAPVKSHADGLHKKRGEEYVSKEVVGIHVLPTCSLFGDDILHRLLLCVSPEKPTSAPLRF